MKWLLLLAASTSCSASSSISSDAAIPVDACLLPSAGSDCVADGFATVNPDGSWHMTGTTTTSVIGDLDPNTPPTVTTTAVDQQVFIQRYGCTAGFGTTEMPPADAATAVSMTAISYACDHAAGCPRGASNWYICVRGDGALVYEERTYRTSTMMGAYETWSMTSAVLTR